MKNDTKKVIAAFLAGAGVTGGGFVATNQLDCPHTIEYQDETLCVSEELRSAIESNLQPNSGFGGIKFGG